MTAPSSQTESGSTGGISPGIGLAGFLLLCYAVAAVGALSTIAAIPTWYAALNKPSFNPPNWIFGPVWTLLYTLMAVAAWMVWRRPSTSSARLDALMVFALQLTLNFLWTPIFFHFHLLLTSVVVIALLWLAIVATILMFWRVSRIAAALLLPYLVWVSFATALNVAILQLNS
jgi:benzodiazapine receptor